jgi:toxin-antitoxin system PIN domain toxin
MGLFLPDANVLINAFLKGAPQHASCARWLLETGANGSQLGLCELVEVALLRIPTLPRLQAAPIIDVLRFWGEDLWNHPRIVRLQASAAHNGILTRLVTELDLVGNDLNDAWLAALAIEHDATLVSLDRGFERFPNLRWREPGGSD